MRRGDVYRLKLKRGSGHEQFGARYGVVVQSDALMNLSTVMVAPTSTSAKPASFRPEIYVGKTKTRVLVEHMAGIDPTRLGTLVGHITPEEQWGVDLALSNLLAIST